MSENHEPKDPNHLKPLSEQELDEIFAPEEGDSRETTSVGRSYGWSDRQER